jgi:hypothetical protein
MPETELLGPGITVTTSISIGPSRIDRKDEHAESNNHDT